MQVALIGQLDGFLVRWRWKSYAHECVDGERYSKGCMDYIDQQSCPCYMTGGHRAGIIHPSFDTFAATLMVMMVVVVQDAG